MDKSIIKMALIVLIISMTLLVGSICLAMKYGGMMMQSSANTSDQTNQTGTINSSNGK